MYWRILFFYIQTAFVTAQHFFSIPRSDAIATQLETIAYTFQPNHSRNIHIVMLPAILQQMLCENGSEMEEKTAPKLEGTVDNALLITWVFDSAKLESPLLR